MLKNNINRKNNIQTVSWVSRVALLLLGLWESFLQPYRHEANKPLHLMTRNAAFDYLMFVYSS